MTVPGDFSILDDAMRRPIPIGVSDFREMREKGFYYVDKSRLIVEMLDRAGAKVLLLPRPRRFGKTLNLSMLRCFFEKRPEDFSHLFEGLAIWEAGEPYRSHFQRYPVIFVTFRDVRGETYEACWAGLKGKIQELYRDHEFLLEAGVFREGEKEEFETVLLGTADRRLYETALERLSDYLHRATGEKVILLIDEYDQPIHAGYINGYTRDVINFFRAFLTSGLKDNPHLERGVLTGILRIARESLFSGLNNLAVLTLLRPEFSTCFGFTEPEVQKLLEEHGRSDRLALARIWYNGYDFGGTTIYNPWSVLNFVFGDEVDARPYWLNTSSNDLIKEALVIWGAKVEPLIEDLLAGRGVLRVLDENVVLDEVSTREDSLWSLLVFGGYLKAEKRSQGEGEQPAHFLSIPNREVRLLYVNTFQEALRTKINSRGGNPDRLFSALFSGDAEILEDQLAALAEAIVSYHDIGIRAAEPFYHGFVLGLLTALEKDYEVRSNRESGKGRPDVMVRPRKPGKPGVILELKVARPGKKTLEQALAEAEAQVRANGYTKELEAQGASPVHAFVVAFDGKNVAVRSVDMP